MANTGIHQTVSEKQQEMFTKQVHYVSFNSQVNFCEQRVWHYEAMTFLLVLAANSI